MQNLAIFNPKAAKGRTGKHFKSISQILSDTGISCDFVQSEFAGHSVKLAQEAVEKGYDRIIAIGGDGTINEIVNGILLSDGDPEVAVIPAGSCNDFVKALKIPTSIHSASHIIKQAKTKRIDVACVGERFFVNAIGLGFDVAVIQALKKIKLLNGFLMYLLMAVFMAMKYKGMELDVTNGKTIYKDKLLMLTIANGISYGGGFKIAPDANPSDGALDVMLLKDMTPLKRFFAIPRFFNGSHVKLPETEMILAKELRISSKYPLTIQVEGELVDWPEKEVKISLRPKRLKFVVP